MVLACIFLASIFIHFIWDTAFYVLGFKTNTKSKSDKKTSKIFEVGMRNIQNKLKLLASMFQILISLPSVLVLVFPSIYSRLLSVFSLVSKPYSINSTMSYHARRSI